MNEEKKPLVILAGPTAVGKSALGVALAKSVGGEILSADSMQVYRGMDIGSAKITPAQMQGVPHHLIDILEPDGEFHVARFAALARQAMEGIWQRGRIPILVGGTGFYIQALAYDIDFTAHGADPAVRARYERLCKEKGPVALHEMLRRVDPASADAIPANNAKRVIRALEYYDAAGEPISLHNARERQKTSPYLLAYFVIHQNRAALYETIDARVDRMIADGLLGEVRALRERGLSKDLPSMQGLGYRQFFAYLDGEIGYEEAVRLIKRDTRHFAKRQLTWFKREPDAIWLSRDDFADDDALLDAICVQLRRLGILPESSR